MTTMIERVARAICAATDVTPENALGGPYFDNPDSLYYFGKPLQSAARWNLYVPAARAAIAAMRVPTEEMLAAWDGGLQPEMRIGWRLGIDAALEEKP